MGLLGACAAASISAPSWAIAPVRQRAPGIVIANVGLSCSGTLIELGDTQERVLRLCGTPTSASHSVAQARGKTTTVDIWRYERYGSFPRLLLSKRHSVFIGSGLSALAWRGRKSGERVALLVRGPRESR